jgi:hypothetical protein
VNLYQAADLSIFIVSRLRQLGWLPDDDDGMSITSGPSPDTLRLYQGFFGLDPTGELDGPTVRSIMSPRMCGCPDVQPMGMELAKWPADAANDLTWYVQPGDFPGLDRQKVLDIFEWSFGQWASVCGISPRNVTTASKALILIECKRIDGVNGTLAWSYLADNTFSVKQQRYDTENWINQLGVLAPSNRIDLNRVAAHEIGHALGVSHLRAGALMQPTYSPDLWTPQASDIAEVQSRYGPPKKPPQPTPPPLPPEGQWSMQIKGTGPKPLVEWATS